MVEHRPTNTEFTYDVFLSHSSRDKLHVRELARRLKADGVKVWFDEWEIQPGDPIPVRIEAGLSASRVLVFVISKHSLGSDWATWEVWTSRFRHPINTSRRFIPLRLDNAELPDAICMFSHVDWRCRTTEEYAKLLAACGGGNRQGERPSIARVYDFCLGGGYNTAVDRATAGELLKVYPDFKNVLIANRAFLRRAVRHLTMSGITQYLDIGSGLPTRGNTHEIAQDIRPDAKVVYVDVDPQVVEASRNLLAKNPNTKVILGDVANPRALMKSPEIELLDLRKPVGLLLVAVLHFITDDNAAINAVRELRQRLVFGSHVVISHASRAKSVVHRSKPLGKKYRSLVSPITQRPYSTLLRFFAGCKLIDPGVVWVPQWHPRISDPFVKPGDLPFTRIPQRSIMLAGVGCVR